MLLRWSLSRVQIGNVTVLAAIKVETMQPTDAAPDAGQVVRESLLPWRVAVTTMPCWTGHARNVMTPLKGASCILCAWQVLTTVEMAPLCSPHTRPGRPSPVAQVHPCDHTLSQPQQCICTHDRIYDEVLEPCCKVYLKPGRQPPAIGPLCRC